MKNIFSKLKRDSWTLGIILGVVLPLIVYGLVMLILMQWGTLREGVYVLKPSTTKLIAIFSNLFTFRYYMVTLKYDRTGRGILLVTFVFAAIFFVLYL
ncbi:MAG: hypothetical protein R6U64_10595 [Bacteroidales bacterium]